MVRRRHLGDGGWRGVTFREECGVKRGNTIEEEALEGLLDLELGVEDYEPEADGEGVVGGAALEVVPDSRESSIVAFLGEGGQMGDGAGAARGATPAHSGGVVGGESCAHEGRVAIRSLQLRPSSETRLDGLEAANAHSQ